jgi:hypothetical protein
MASLHTLYLKKDTIQTLLNACDVKNVPGIEITISVNDESNKYDQNVSAHVSQSKEDRQSKKPKYYVGNGRTFWTDGKVQVLESKKDPIKSEPAKVDVTKEPDFGDGEIMGIPF